MVESNVEKYAYAKLKDSWTAALKTRNVDDLMELLRKVLWLYAVSKVPETLKASLTILPMVAGAFAVVLVRPDGILVFAAVYLTTVLIVMAVVSRVVVMKAKNIFDVLIDAAKLKLEELKEFYQTENLD